MKIQFYKYQGAGNDFIVADNRDLKISHNDTGFIAGLCDRHFGIGADGMMFIENKEGYDFEMVYYNADGKPGSMCGNGGRCIVSFAKFLGIINSETVFMAADGPHYAKVSESGEWVSLHMIDVNEVKTDGDAYVLNTGSPHYIQLCSGLQNKDVYTDGRAIRYNETYAAHGINVNYVEDLGDRYLVRTYERGVENETFACGTGATAAALSMAKHKNQQGHISTAIQVLGGELNIKFDYDGTTFTNVFLEGPAKFVFTGEVEAMENASLTEAQTK